jgi:hypothetical protein
LNERVRRVTTNLARSPAADEESFAAKLVKAVAVRLPTSRTVKQAKEQAERERNRYKPFQRRARTKGE